MLDITGGGGGSTTTPTTPAVDLTTAIAAQAALTKLTGGQTLTSAEQALLNIGSTTPPPAAPVASSNTVIDPVDFGILNLSGIDFNAFLNINPFLLPGATPIQTTNTTSTTTTTPTPTSTVATPAPIPYIAPIPFIPPTPSPPPPPPPIKVATPQFVLFSGEDTLSADIIPDLLLENIGGHELLTISRNDTINGQSVAYQPIKNLNLIQNEYNPNTLIKLQQTSDKFFNNFPIKLNDKIPNTGNGQNGSNVYLDSSGNLIIEFINLAIDEQVEVQITSNGTIYEVGE